MIKQYFKIRRFHRVILSSVSSSERRISIFFFLLPRFASHFLVVAKEIRGIDSFPICVYEEPSPLVPRLLERKLRRRAMPLPFVTETYREAAGSFSRQKRFPAKRERRRGAREPVSPFLVRKEDFPPYVLARFFTLSARASPRPFPLGGFAQTFPRRSDRRRGRHFLLSFSFRSRTARAFPFAGERTSERVVFLFPGFERGRAGRTVCQVK